jgi:curved DNA-binding protein
VAAHHSLKRKGDDLYAAVKVDLYAALLGGSAQITTLKGSMKIKVPPESDHGSTLRLKGLGMPKYGAENAFGDLYVQIAVELPHKLTEKEKELFENLAALRAQS